MSLDGFPDVPAANLAQGRVQTGTRSSPCDPIIVELVAGAGFR